MSAATEARRSPSQFLYDQVAVARWHLQRRATPQALPFDRRSTQPGQHPRVLIGPANSAGQGYLWARSLESVHPTARVTSMAFQRQSNHFGHSVDQPVPSEYAAHSRAWQRKQQRAVQQFDAALIESAQPPFSRLLGGSSLAQITQLQASGVKCAFIFHGSDLRDPDHHIAAEPHSHFSVDDEFYSRMKETTARSRKLIRESRLPVFVSTPDLLSEVVGAKWLPVVVDVDVWAVEEAPLQHEGAPRVVHVPSSSLVKGTDLITGTLQQMHDSGIIHYQSVSGVVHADMPEIYKNADIVVDQFRVGNYGVAACEAMAAGRIVVSHVSDTTRERTTGLTGLQLPIVEATPDTLRSVLEDILEVPDSALSLAGDGPEFVRRCHNGALSGKVLADWLEEES